MLQELFNESSIPFNIELFYIINTELNNSFFNFLMPKLTNIGNEAILLIILLMIIIFSHYTKKKILFSIAIMAIMSVLIAGLITSLIKISFLIPRPPISLEGVHLLIYESDPNSFPSGHTANIFAAVTSIILSLKKYELLKEYIIHIFLLIIMAVLIAFSRIYCGVHYPFDVFIGAIIGILSSLAIYKLIKFLKK